MMHLLKMIIFVVFITFFNCKKETKKIPLTITTPPQWTSLFNGENLNGWIPKFNGYELGDNYKNTFRVEEGVLKVSYSAYETFVDQYGHLFYKTSFSKYKLRLQYRFIGKQVKGGESWATKNSGIMIHCQSPESMLIKQAFPVSLEAQLLGGVQKEEARPSGNLCTPGTHVVMNSKQITDHCISADCKTYYGDEWITVEIVVNNDSIKHYIDRKLVITYSKPTIGGQFLESASKEIQEKNGEVLTSGYISLQSESHPIEFKNIEMLIL